MPTHRALRHRRSGIVGEPTRFYPEDIPYSLPQQNAYFWRYLELSHFIDFCRTSELYLARVDCFPDQLEGLPSERGVHGSSKSDRAFSRQYPLKDVYDELTDGQRVARRNTFACCWNLNQGESELLWQNMSKKRVAVRTTRDQLRAVDRGPGVSEVSLVKYVERSFARTELDLLAFFFYKDKYYAYEHELRIVVDPRVIVAENDISRRLRVSNLGGFVSTVVTHPLIRDEEVREVDSVMEQYLPHLKSQRSRFTMKFLRQSVKNG